MRPLVLTIFLVINSTIFSQLTSEKTIISESYFEVFNVLASKEYIKHGEYKRFSNDSLLLINGKYEYGYKRGVWTYYGKNEVVYKQYDFDSLKLVFYNSKADSIFYFVRKKDTCEKLILDWPPLYSLGEEAIYEYIQSNIHYPKKASKNNTEGTVYVSFFVNKKGEAVDHFILKSVTPELDQEAIRIVKKLPGKWSPGIINKEPVEVRITIPLIFRIAE